ncbi:unnamed protein product [Pieris brassicae]|uniref:Uncharacterized protein n=1 Tax=Pieris brassicae TaxID=7116 RepID=A0A9P0T042_PIEBR|nr:unnamed protein product [Pieris brassicae]
MYRVILMAFLCPAVSSLWCIGHMPCRWKHPLPPLPLPDPNNISPWGNFETRFMITPAPYENFGTGVMITPAPRGIINKETTTTQTIPDLENMDVYRESSGGRGFGGNFNPK